MIENDKGVGKPFLLPSLLFRGGFLAHLKERLIVTKRQFIIFTVCHLFGYSVSIHQLPDNSTLSFNTSKYIS
jgi:hypothetical protein